MGRSYIEYDQVRISHQNIGKYTIKNDGVYVTDIASDMADVTNFAKQTNYFHNLHTHDFYNIAWIEQGGFDYEVDMNTYHVEDKSILMFIPGGTHCLRNTEAITGITIDFTEDYFRSIDPAWAHTIKFDVMNGVHVLPIRDPQTEHHIKELLSLLQSYTQNKGESILHTAQIYSTLTLLFCVIANSRELSVIKPIINTPNRETYLAFMDKTEQDFRKHHSVQFYAEELHVSINMLNSCCKMNSGKTPLTIISDRILLEAKRMLLYTELHSSEISTCLGFIEPAHFSNFFKKHTKMTPIKFRESNKKCS